MSVSDFAVMSPGVGRYEVLFCGEKVGSLHVERDSLGVVQSYLLLSMAARGHIDHQLLSKLSRGSNVPIRLSRDCRVVSGSFKAFFLMANNKCWRIKEPIFQIFKRFENQNGCNISKKLQQEEEKETPGAAFERVGGREL